MSWWDNFTNAISNALKPAYTQEQAKEIKALYQTEKFKKFQTEVQKTNLPLRYGGVSAAAEKAYGVGSVEAQAVREPFRATDVLIADLTMTPSRLVREAAAAPFLAATTGMSIADAYGVTRGNREGKEWWQGGDEAVSFGQSVFGALGRALPGVQDVDKIDFTDNKQVAEFFSKGPQKFVTGYLDATSTIAFDPLIWGNAAGRSIRLRTMVNPIRSAKDIQRSVKELDVAAAGQPSRWTPFVNFIMENANDESALLGRSNVFESMNSDDLVASVTAAARKGDRQLVADILKVSIGDENTIERLTARKDMLSANVAKWRLKLDELEKGALTVPNQEYVDTVRDAVSRATETNEVLLRALGKTDPTTGRVMYTGVPEALASRTVSNFSWVENLRNKAARTRQSTIFNEQRVSVEGLPVRVLTWLSPSGPIKEAPSGIFNIGNFGAKESWRELVATSRVVARQTGKDYRPQMNEYIRLGTKEERWTYLQNLEKQFVEDMIVSKVFQNKTVSPLAMESVNLLADRLIGTKQRLSARVWGDTIDRNYVIYDGTGDPVVVKQLQDWIAAQAKAEGRTVESLVDELRNAPQLGSQAASTYTFMDAQAYSDVIEESSLLIRQLLSIVDETLEPALQAGISQSQIRKNLSEAIDDILENPKAASTSGLDTAGQAANLGSALTPLNKANRDLLTQLADNFYGTVWKPLTLLSLKYGVRNVLEGATRSVVYMNELASNTGVSRKDVYADWLGNPIESVANTAANMKSRLTAAAQRRNAAALSPRLRAAALTQDSFVAASAKNVKQGLSETLAMANRIATFKESKKVLRKDIVEWLDNPNAFISQLKTGEARRFVTMLLDGDIDDALRLGQEIKDLSSFSRDLSSLRNKMLDIAQGFDDPALQAKYSQYFDARSVKMITNYQETLVDTASSLDNLIASKVNSAAAWGEFDKLIVGTNPILRRSGDGTFKVAPGVEFPDYGKDQLGMFARGESAADKTYANAVLSTNRLIGEGFLRRTMVNVDVLPTDKNWSKAFVDFINGDFRSDAVIYRILNGESDENIVKFLSSPDQRGYLETIGLGQKFTRKDLQNHIDKSRILADLYAPEIPGAKRGLLKETIRDGKFDEKIALGIPQDFRPTISGTDVAAVSKVKNLGQIWRQGVSTVFKYIGTLPETVLSRHPFYRAVYRTEVRRIAKIAKQQGTDITSAAFIDRAQRAAHRRAFKTLNETLYTVERRSDPAQFLRFVSPFYMAQQSSSRYWLGQTFKNPGLVHLGLLAWNTPNQVFDVVDESGNSVESSLPFLSNERILLTLPEPVAKLFNVSEQDFITLSKTSMDLVTNGAIPVIPQISGALVTIPATAILERTDAQAFLSDLGFAGDFVETAILPYLDTYRTDAVEQLTPMPAWLRSFINGTTSTKQSAARTNLIFEQKMLEAEMNGIELTPKQVAKAIEDAADEANRSYLIEAMFSFGSPFSTKLTNEQQLLKQEYGRYIQRYGQVEGALKAEKDLGVIKTSYARSSLSDNPAGLLATPQTERNLRQHSGLAAELAAQGNDAFAMLGNLFNEGARDDYSALVNSRFYETNIGGKPIKSTKSDLEDIQRERNVNLGWSYYIPMKQALTAYAEKNGIGVNTKAWDERIKPALDKYATMVATKFPAWEDARRSIDTGRDFRNYRALRYAFYNGVKRNKDGSIQTDQMGNPVWSAGSYMSTIGKKNPIGQALTFWVPFRDSMALQLATRESKDINAKSNADIKAALENYAQMVSARFPEFATVYERSLSGDTLHIVKK
jgi:hypothetical protein